jgi:hypothetical protein
MLNLYRMPGRAPWIWKRNHWVWPQEFTSVDKTKSYSVGLDWMTRWRFADSKRDSKVRGGMEEGRGVGEEVAGRTE